MKIKANLVFENQSFLKLLLPITGSYLYYRYKMTEGTTKWPMIWKWSVFSLGNAAAYGKSGPNSLADTLT